MGVKRSEAEVLGHDNTLHAAIKELTRGRRGADPLHNDRDRDHPESESAYDREKLYRYGEHTVPPEVFEAMAAVDLGAVDLRAVDEQAASPSKSTDAPPQPLASRKRSPVLLVFAALVVVGGAAAWLLGSAHGRGDASPVPTPLLSAEPPPPPAPSAVASARESTPASATLATLSTPPTPSPTRTTSPRPPTQQGAIPKATTTKPSDPDYDPNRPVL